MFGGIDFIGPFPMFHDDIYFGGVKYVSQRVEAIVAPPNQGLVVLIFLNGIILMILLEKNINYRLMSLRKVIMMLMRVCALTKKKPRHFMTIK